MLRLTLCATLLVVTLSTNLSRASQPGDICSTQCWASVVGGRVTCIGSCPEGSQLSAGPPRQCVSCAAGTFKSTAGNGSCTPCPPGSFSAAGKSVCTKCPAGTFSARSGSSECTKCDGGTYSNTEGSTKCQKCDPNFGLGRFSGMTECDLCPDSGFKFGGENCYPKIKLSCTPSLSECNKSIDNNLGNYGESYNYHQNPPAGYTVDQTHFVYSLKQAANVVGFVVWPGKNYKVDDLNGMKIVLKSAWETELRICHPDSFKAPYSFFPDCKAKDVASIIINHRSGKPFFKFAEVAFYGY